MLVSELPLAVRSGHNGPVLYRTNHRGRTNWLPRTLALGVTGLMRPSYLVDDSSISGHEYATGQDLPHLDTGWGVKWHCYWRPYSRFAKHIDDNVVVDISR